jgi:2-oxoglutarate dehydrogenase E2 component (dihydrolipoamide succinyltransferase)
MKVDISIPQLGESISEVVIGTFLKPSGSTVKKDEEIVEIETEKVNQVLHAPAGGIITWTVQQGETVPIGHTIGSVDTEGKAEGIKPSPPREEKPKKEVSPQQPSPPSPKVEAPPPTKPPAAGVEKVMRRKMSQLRKVIARKLVEAKNNTAMLTTFNEIDMSRIIELRTREKENFQAKYGVKLGFMSFFVKACVAALKEFPDAHSFIEGEEIVTPQSFDIGIAVSTERGLIVPVVRACDTKSFAEIEQNIEQLAQKARNSTISIDDLQGGSFTITNGGVFGSLLSTPILNPPQSAILGMHTIVKRPVVENEQIVIRPMMYLALSYDHRIIDGKEAVLFLVHCKKLLEDPARLFLENS